MSPELRQQLTAQLQDHQSIAWAGVVAELGGHYMVHLFRRNEAPGNHYSLRMQDSSAVVVEMSIEQSARFTADPILYSTLLGQLGAVEPLIGHDITDVFAARMNAAANRAGLSAGALIGGTQSMIGGMMQGPALHKVGALRARALYEYLVENNEFPTNAQFQAWLAPRGEPWAIALRKTSRNEQDVTASVLQMQLMGQPANAPAAAFPNADCLRHWYRPNEPHLGRRMEVTATAPVAGTSVAAPRERTLVTLESLAERTDSDRTVHSVSVSQSKPSTRFTALNFT